MTSLRIPRCSVWSALLLALIPAPARAGSPATAPPATQPAALARGAGSEAFQRDLQAANAEWDDLWLRIALEGDVWWAWNRWATQVRSERLELDTRIRDVQTQRAAEVEVLDAARAWGERGRARSRRANPAKGSEAWTRLEALRRVKTAYEAERAAWEAVRPNLAEGAWESWVRVRDAMDTGSLWLAGYWHASLENPGDIDGQALGAALDEWLKTWPTTVATDDLVAVGLADASVVASQNAEARISAAAERLDRTEKLLVTLDARRAELDALLAHGQGLTIERAAREVWRTYDGLITRSLLEPILLSNDDWASLFWRGGSAAMLAGNKGTAQRLLDQAVAVSPGRGRLEAVPRSVAPLIAEAGDRVKGRRFGTLRIHGRDGILVTVDGEAPPVGEGEDIDLDLPPGHHRVAFSVAGATGPLVQIVELAAGDLEDVRWTARPLSRGEVPLLRLSTGSAPEASATIAASHVRDPGPLSFGAGFVGFMGHGTLSAGARLSADYRLGPFDVRADGAWLSADAPIWLRAGEEAVAFTQFSASGAYVAPAGPLALSAGAGAWMTPDIGGGPLVRGGVGVDVGAVAIELDTRFGWDVARHSDDIPRWTVAAGVTASIRP